MKRTALLILLLFFGMANYGQNLSNLVRKDIVILNDSMYIDSLSIVPGTFMISCNDTILAPYQYTLSAYKALLIFTPNNFSTYKNKSCRVSYRVFQHNLSAPFYHKPLFADNDATIRKHYTKKINEKGSSGIHSFSGLKTAGSISRGITAGNNQSTGLSSDFNLQLSGKISPGIRIQANITDSNIPIQADGSSQNLKEFDNIFIRLISEKSVLTAGDLVIRPTESHFMKFNKKVKGADFKTMITSGKNIALSTELTAALAKGQFNKMTFTGTEGNRGPYRLTGKNGELYIIILSGSEKIYLDGKLLKRGNENDYVIDYNSGELSFTSEQIITKDSRIIAEFEYSEKNYARFTAGSFTQIKTKNIDFFFNIFTENDAKNNGLSQDLTDAHKQMFRSVGDDIENAFINSAVLVDTFNRNEVLYQKADTFVNSLFFKDIFRYSTDSLKAKYRVSFNFVGENKGNYRQKQNGTNGRVYEWVAPEGGIPQGDYEPVKLLISPKKKLMLTAGVLGNNKKTGKFLIETALSNNDQNTFSDLGDEDNTGYALRIKNNKNFIQNDTALHSLNLHTNYQFIHKNFKAFESFKSAEFDRDWNLLPSKALFDEHFASLQLEYTRKHLGRFGIESDLLTRDRFYRANRNSVSIKIDKPAFLTEIAANRLTSKDTLKRTEFIRYKGKLEKKTKHISFGIEDQGEKNLFSHFSDTLADKSSYRFNEFAAYLQNRDSSKNLFSLRYLNREDFLPGKNGLSYSSTAHNINFKAKLASFKNQTIKINANYRNLHTQDTVAKSFGEQTFSGKLTYSFKLLKELISSSTFFEHTGGSEPVKEYAYFEVQSGQGMFAWKDFNGNNIKELNEFVKANFSDEANYIRISLPATKYKPVYNQTFYALINLDFKKLKHSSKGFKKFVAPFSNHFMFKLNRKTDTGTDYFKPVIPDSLLISNSNMLKNRFSFNAPKQQTQLHYIYINTSSKNTLFNGTEKRINMFHGIELNKKIADFIFENNFKIGNKKYKSDFFTESNYVIDYTENESSLNFKIDKRNNIKGKFNIKQKENIGGEEKLKSYTVGGEYKFSSVNKGRLQLNFDYAKISFKGAGNTSVSYEILEGLQDGKNFIWSVTWYKKLTKYLQLEFNYSGRKSEESKTIHTGAINIRAFF